MNLTRWIVLGVTAAGAGLFLSFGILWLLPRLPLPPTHQAYQSLGIRKPVIIGFQPSWLLSKADKDYADYITETTYFGLVLDTDGTILKQVNAREEEPGWTTLRGENLRKRLTADAKDNLQLSLLIHQSNEASISALLTQPEQHAQNLVAEITPLMREQGYTDLNLDVESFKESSPAAQLAFKNFMMTLKQGLANNQLGTLTVELTPAALINSHLITPADLGQIADRVVLMGYDFHYRGSEIAGPVAPVGGAGEVRKYDVETSLKEALKVIPADKLILGVPLYGYKWETLSAQPGLPVIPGSSETASERRVEELLASCDNCSTGTDFLSQQPYVVQPNADGYYVQMFYEDAASLQKKIELAQKYRLQGLALWALGYEGSSMLEPLKQYRSSFFWR